MLVVQHDEAGGGEEQSACQRVGHVFGSRTLTIRRFGSISPFPCPAAREHNSRRYGSVSSHGMVGLAMGSINAIVRLTALSQLRRRQANAGEPIFIRTRHVHSKKEKKQRNGRKKDNIHPLDRSPRKHRQSPPTLMHTLCITFSTIHSLENATIEIHHLAIRTTNRNNLHRAGKVSSLLTKSSLAIRQTELTQVASRQRFWSAPRALIVRPILVKLLAQGTETICHDQNI